MVVQIINTCVTEKFDNLIEELTRRGMLKGLGAMAGAASTAASGSEPVATRRRPDGSEFISRAELLISYLESGIRPKEIEATPRSQVGDKQKQFGKAYEIAYGGISMGEDIDNMSYYALTNKYGTKKTAKGKYQIIAPTFTDLVKNGLYESVPDAKRNFSALTQDAIFEFMSHKKYNFKKAVSEYNSGNVDKAIYYLSREWASIPRDKSNLSYYDGDGRNKALIDYDIVKRFLLGELGIDEIKKA